MIERPILFSGPMVRAIIEGYKTQTRRVVRPQPIGRLQHYGHGHWADSGAEYGANYVRCPYGVADDRLWIRETFAIVPHTAYRHDPSIPHRVSPCGEFWAVYKEGWDRSAPRWKPSIHIPRWASRLTLVIESVGIERVQAIDQADARAEGIESCTVGRADLDHFPCKCVERFSSLWESIHGNGSWDLNPLVWVLRFHRLDTLGGDR